MDIRDIILVLIFIVLACIADDIDDINKLYEKSLELNIKVEESIKVSELKECQNSKSNIIFGFWKCTPRDDKRLTIELFKIIRKDKR